MSCITLSYIALAKLSLIYLFYEQLRFNGVTRVDITRGSN